MVDRYGTHPAQPTSTLLQPLIDLGAGRTAIAIAVATYHTCAILDNGDVKCWGWDNYGQLGDGGSNTNLNTPSTTAINLGTGRISI